MNHDGLQLCDKLLLLPLNDDGKLVSGGTTDMLLAGALLADLVVRGRVDIAGPGESTKAGRVAVRTAEPAGDSLLDGALERVRRRQGARPITIIGYLSKGTRQAVLERLTEAGMVGESSRKVLGLFRTRSWPAVDGRPAAHTRLAVQRVVERGGPPDCDTAVLISLVLAGDVLHKVLPTTDRKAQKRRAEEIADGDWAPAATRKALHDIAAAVTETLAGGFVAATG